MSVQIILPQNGPKELSFFLFRLLLELTENRVPARLQNRTD